MNDSLNDYLQEDKNENNTFLSSLCLGDDDNEEINLNNNLELNYDAFNRLKNDKETLMQVQEKLEMRITVLKQDLGYSENREKALKEQLKKDKLAWDREREEMRKQILVIQNREKQYLHDLKKKDLMYEKLKEKVSEVQKGATKTTTKVLNPIPKTTLTGKVVTSTTKSTIPKSAKTLTKSIPQKPTITTTASSLNNSSNNNSPIDHFKIAWQNEQKKSTLLFEENQKLRKTLKLLQEEFHDLLVDANLSDERVNEEVFDLPSSLLNEILEETKFNMKQTGNYLKENPVTFINEKLNHMGLDKLEKTVSMMKNQFSEDQDENSENVF